MLPLMKPPVISKDAFSSRGLTRRQFAKATLASAAVLGAPAFPRGANHHHEWIAMCKGGPKALSNFDYAGWLTEANHLGNVAYRTGRKLTWDAVAMRDWSTHEADKFITREYKNGWRLV